MKPKFFYLLLMVILLAHLIDPVFCQDNESKDSVENSKTDNNNFSTWDILSFLFGLVGLVGTFYTIYSYQLAKKDKEANRVIFEAAAKSLDIETIEKDIEHKKKLQDNYATENKKSQENLKLLRKQIEKDIPNEARKAVLKGKIRSQEELLIQTYDSLLLIKKELNEVENDTQISPEIQKMVENEIRPEYTLREEQSRIKSYLIIFTTGATISSSLLPSPFDRIFTSLFCILAISPIIKMAKSQLSDSPILNNKKNLLMHYTYVGSLVILFMFTLISIDPELFYSPYVNNGEVRWDMVLSSLFLSGMCSVYITKKLISMRLRLNEKS